MTAPIISTYKDKNIKFQYSESQQGAVDPQNAIGASTTIRTLDFIPSDANTIYVKKTGNDNNAGTAANPVLTIDKATTLTTASKTHIVILDSNTYAVNGLYISGNTVGIYAAVGFTPTLSVNYCYGSAGATKTTDTTSLTGTYCTTPNTHAFLGLKKGLYFDVSGSFVAVGGHGDVIAGPGYLTDIHVIGSNYTKIHTLDIVTSRAIGETPVARRHPESNIKLIQDSRGYVWIFPKEYLNENPSLKYRGYYVYDPDGNIIFDGHGTDYNVLQYTITPPTILGVTGVGYTNADLLVAYSSGTNISAFKMSTFTGLATQTGIALVSDTGITALEIVTLPAGSTYALDYCVIWQSGTTIKYKIIDHTNFGITKDTATLFTLTGVLLNNVITLLDGNICIGYSVTGPQCNYFRIYNPETGNVVVTEQTLQTYAVSAVTSVVNHINGNILSMGAFNYQVWTPPNAYFIKCAVNAQLDGLIITTPTTNVFCNFIESSNKNLTLKNCTFEDIAYDIGVTSLVHGTGNFSILRNIFRNCQKILDVTTNSLDVEYCLFYWNDGGFAVTNTGSGTSIKFDHNIFFSNYGGINLISNNGNEVITNNVFKSNINGAITAETEILITYCCCVDTLTNATISTGSIILDPRFRDEGLVDENDIDLSFKTIVLGDGIESPCIGTDSAGDDMGCYVVEYTINAPTYEEITVIKPHNLACWTEPLNLRQNVTQLGNIHQEDDGEILKVQMSWEGISNANVTKLYAMRRDKGNIRIYFEPDSSPTIYYNVKLIPNKFSLSPSKHYSFSEYGVNDLELNFQGVMIDE